MTSEGLDQALLARVFAAWRVKLGSVHEQLHPVWGERMWACAGAGASRALPASALDRALLAALKLTRPALASLQRPSHRLALLCRDELLRVLAAVDLLGARDRVRRSIDRADRAVVIEAIGEDAYLRLLRLPPRGDDDPPRLPPRSRDERALQGHAALRASGQWRDRACAAWIRYALPPEGQRGDVEPTGPADASVFPHLSLLFPEHAWLFGPDMDRILSAQKAP